MTHKQIVKNTQSSIYSAKNILSGAVLLTSIASEASAEVDALRQEDKTKKNDASDEDSIISNYNLFARYDFLNNRSEKFRGLIDLSFDLGKSLDLETGIEYIRENAQPNNFFVGRDVEALRLYAGLEFVTLELHHYFKHVVEYPNEKIDWGEKDRLYAGLFHEDPDVYSVKFLAGDLFDLGHAGIISLSGNLNIKPFDWLRVPVALNADYSWYDDKIRQASLNVDAAALFGGDLKGGPALGFKGNYTDEFPFMHSDFYSEKEYLFKYGVIVTYKEPSSNLQIVAYAGFQSPIYADLKSNNKTNFEFGIMVGFRFGSGLFLPLTDFYTPRWFKSTPKGWRKDDNGIE